MKKEMRRMEIEPAENGGHTVTHHYREMQREGKHGIQTSYVEPEHHVFGADEGHDMLAHVANHLAIPEPNEPDEPAVDEGEDEDRPPAEARMTKEKAAKVREKAA
jgi:hypothetical protein